MPFLSPVPLHVLTIAHEYTSTLDDIPLPSPDAALSDVTAQELEEKAADDDGALSDTGTNDSEFGSDNPSCSYGPGGNPSVTSAYFFFHI